MQRPAQFNTARNRGSLRAVGRDLGLTLICSGVLFWAAGTVRWLNAWVYLALVLLQQAAQVTLPVILLSVVFIVRTAVEDRFLQQNLEGYRRYMTETRHHLISYIW